MNGFSERYKKILQYLNTSSGEQEALSALGEISHEYLQLLIRGVHARETKEVLEATRQMAYLKSALERHLETKDAYHRFLYQVGVGAGQYKTGEVWLQEQGNEDGFERNMTVLYGRKHMRDIVEAVYANPGIQHKNLAELTGVKANFLTQLTASLTEAGCLYRYGTRKCTYYELTLQGKEYVSKKKERNMYKWLYDRMLKEYEKEGKIDLIHKLMIYKEIEVSDRSFADQCFSGKDIYNINELFDYLRENLKKCDPELFDRMEEAASSWAYIISGLSKMKRATRASEAESAFKKRVSEAQGPYDSV